MSLFRYLATDIQEETKESNIPQTIPVDASVIRLAHIHESLLQAIYC